MNNSYRERIYKDYGSNFQDASEMLGASKVERWKRGYRYYFRGWLPEDKHAAVLEVACGNGRMLGLLKELGYTNITGVDISPEQVQLAKKFHDNVVQADILEWLEDHADSYDLIIGMDIIEHFDKSEVFRFLDASKLALRNGGMIILQTPNCESPMGIDKRYGDFSHELSFNYSLLSRILINSGFNKPQGREVGPVPLGHSVKSFLRNLIWQYIRLTIMIWNLAEIGIKGSGIFTRVFLIKAAKNS